MSEEHNLDGEVIQMDKFIPRDYQLDFVSSMETGGYKKAVLAWPRRCIWAFSRITMHDGSTRQIKQLKKGDKILSFDGKDVVTDTVKDVWATGEKEVIDVKTHDGPVLTVTLDHRFLSNADTMEWVEAKDLKVVYRYERGILKRLGGVVRSESYKEDTYDIETDNHHNFFANGYLVHNSGKDICAWNLLVRAAVRDVGSYIYCLPSFSMCRRVLLNSKLHDGSSFMDFIPKKLIKSFNQQEMKITLINGSIIIMIGSDNAKERVVGMAAKGLVISEAALASPVGISYLQPMITASDGFIIFISTPRGHNKFWELYNTAKRAEDWYVSKLTVDNTKHVPIERIEKDILSGVMSRELAQQEWWTSFSSQNQGSYYGKYIDNMLKNDQLTVVPYEPSLQTYCFMDIGVNDMFVILFVQVTSLTIRIFDYYENHSEGLEHYTNLMKSKNYGQIIVYAPHDISVRELTTGTSRLEKLRGMMPEVHVVPISGINDGIEAVRTILPKTYIDNKKCDKLIKAVENYTKEYDEVNQVYKNKPNHNKYCFLGFHKVLTPDGEIPIRDIKVGDEVITPIGVRKVLSTFKRRARKLLDIDIRVGNNIVTLTTTAGHKIFTSRGFVRAVSLHKKDLLEPYGKLRSYFWKKVYSINGNNLGFKDYISGDCPSATSMGFVTKLITIIQLFFLPTFIKLVDFFDSVMNRHFVSDIREYKTAKFHDVYDITVDIDHCYYIDGYLVSNSHANDALRYLAVSHKKLGHGMSAEDLDERYANAVHGKSNKVPRIFQ